MKDYNPKGNTGSNWSDIWKRFKNGDTGAFESIYNSHVDFLFNFGRNMTNNIEIIEDAIQDLFLYLFSKRDQVITPNHVRYYLLKAFKRILIEKIRFERKSQGRMDDAWIDFHFEIDTENVAEKKIEEKKIALIEGLIGKLEPKKKEVIFLKFQGGLSYAEISDIVGIQSSSVKQIVYRVITSFREIVKDQALELFVLFIRCAKY